MLRLIIIFSIIAIIAIILIAFIFRHEIETLAHKYGLRDDFKHLKHELKRKENELKSLGNGSSDMFEKAAVLLEIERVKRLIDEMENKSNE